MCLYRQFLAQVAAVIVELTVCQLVCPCTSGLYVVLYRSIPVLLTMGLVDA